MGGLAPIFVAKGWPLLVGASQFEFLKKSDFEELPGLPAEEPIADPPKAFHSPDNRKRPAPHLWRGGFIGVITVTYDAYGFTQPRREGRCAPGASPKSVA